MAEMERACHCTGADIQAIYKISLFFAIFCCLFFDHLAHPPGLTGVEMEQGSRHSQKIRNSGSAPPWAIAPI
jgi:hypothetical protein